MEARTGNEHKFAAIWNKIDATYGGPGWFGVPYIPESWILPFFFFFFLFAEICQDALDWLGSLRFSQATICHSESAAPSLSDCIPSPNGLNMKKNGICPSEFLPPS